MCAEHRVKNLSSSILPCFYFAQKASCCQSMFSNGFTTICTVISLVLIRAVILSYQLHFELFCFFSGQPCSQNLMLNILSPIELDCVRKMRIILITSTFHPSLFWFFPGDTDINFPIRSGMLVDAIHFRYHFPYHFSMFLDISRNIPLTSYKHFQGQ